MSASIEMATSGEDNEATAQVFILTSHWQFIQWHAFCQSRELFSSYLWDASMSIDTREELLLSDAAECWGTT